MFIFVGSLWLFHNSERSQPKCTCELAICCYFIFCLTRQAFRRNLIEFSLNYTKLAIHHGGRAITSDLSTNSFNGCPSETNFSNPLDRKFWLNRKKSLIDNHYKNICGSVKSAMLSIKTCMGKSKNTAKKLSAVGIEPETSCVLLWCLPDWVNLASASWGIFNFTFVGAPIDFWTWLY